MLTKIVRFQIEKAQIDATVFPPTPSELRQLIQDFLFEWLRKINDNCEKILQSNSQEVVNLCLQNPEIQQWKNPSDEEIRQLVQSQESAKDPAGKAGWSYSVKEEALYMNGVLKIYTVEGRSSFPVSKWMQFAEFPGFHVSEETIND